jgi:hypothetical protein
MRGLALVDVAPLRIRGMKTVRYRSAMSARCPFRPRLRTYRCAALSVAKGQEATSRLRFSQAEDFATRREQKQKPRRSELQLVILWRTGLP